MIFVTWILLAFPMFVSYDKDKQVRFVACGLLYHIIDVFLKNRGDN